MSTATIAAGHWQEARSRAKRAVARMARRVLPDATVRLSHVEPDVHLHVNVRRNLMFWSSGLARFEPACVRLLRAAVGPGEVAVDVGANIGFFSTLLSRWVGPEGRVVAIEPDPENLTLLQRNLDANFCENVEICACAVGAHRGLGEFSRDRATGCTGRLGRQATDGERAVGRGRVEVVPIRVETIDILCDDHDAFPAVLKLDIEGGEIHALEGAAGTIEDCRPVILTELAGERGPEVIALLRRFGYEVRDVETGRPADAGPSPFMALGLPAEAVGMPRGRRVLTALHGGPGGLP